MQDIPNTVEIYQKDQISEFYDNYLIKHMCLNEASQDTNRKEGTNIKDSQDHCPRFSRAPNNDQNIIEQNRFNTM